MDEIIDYLSSKEWIYFDDLLICYEDKLEIIVTFLALLELIKQKDVSAVQIGSFNRILISKVSIR